MKLAIAELYDANPDKVDVARSVFQTYGGVTAFHGKIVTIKVDHDFLLVKQTLQQPGEGCVLVVDGDGALDCALMGDRLGAIAVENKWSGIVVNGCIRDVEEINALDIGVKALNSCPIRPAMEGPGKSGIAVNFAGVTFRPGEFLYADLDGILVSAEALVLP